MLALASKLCLVSLTERKGFGVGAVRLRLFSEKRALLLDEFSVE